MYLLIEANYLKLNNIIPARIFYCYWTYDIQFQTHLWGK